MGKNRWRQRAGQTGIPQRPRRKRIAPPVQASVSIESVTPLCPGMERPGLDGIVYLGLQKIDTLVRDMRRDVLIPNRVWDEESAVKRYLAYLSMLVDIALSDIAMSAVHSNDIAVLMEERMLVEYANKALYFNDHGDYALYMTTINEAQSVRDRTRDGGGSAADLAAAEQELAERSTRFAHVSHLRKVTVSAMMREHTRGGDPMRNDEYVWLYGAPSALMHGDSEGMRLLLPVDENGHARPTIRLSDAHVNALMVDSGSNALIFCQTFVDRFHPNDEAFAKRLSDLAREFKALSIKHSEGRDAEALRTLEVELAADALQAKEGKS